tara:strand:+ start:1965 stop:3263 length:1299 start_codon:yes stop_codon:yes gene_type:complete
MDQIKQKKSTINYKDYTKKYASLVSFNSNQHHSRHRWYPFVEGFSTEFVRDILGEQKIYPESCLEPFGGIGTTSLTCQEFDVKCHSIESNPFFFNTAKGKLLDYSGDFFDKMIVEFELYLKNCKSRTTEPQLESKTFFESSDKSKWIFNRPVANAIADILKGIKEICFLMPEYANLFEIALASILVPFSNVYRNGKCLSYRKDWKARNFTRKQVHSKFLETARVYLIDIKSSERKVQLTENISTSFNADSRIKLNEFENESFDLCITSPPYLNSRDYTDVYRLELWILGYVSDFNVERNLRKRALTSHVQIKLPETDYPDIDDIENYLSHLKNLNGNLWNSNIPNMIKGYFNDMDGIISNIYDKLKFGGKAYINVSNSSYGGKICQVDEILAQIGENAGFEIEEIRIARYISSSAQQKNKDLMRESVIVLNK